MESRPLPPKPKDTRDGKFPPGEGVYLMRVLVFSFLMWLVILWVVYGII